MHFTFLCDWSSEADESLIGERFAIAVSAHSHSEAAHLAATHAIAHYDLGEVHDPTEFWHTPGGARIFASQIGNTLGTLTTTDFLTLDQTQEGQQPTPCCPQNALLKTHHTTLTDALSRYAERMDRHAAYIGTQQGTAAVGETTSAQLIHDFTHQKEKAEEAIHEINAIA